MRRRVSAGLVGVGMLAACGDLPPQEPAVQGERIGHRAETPATIPAPVTVETAEPPTTAGNIPPVPISRQSVSTSTTSTTVAGPPGERLDPLPPYQKPSPPPGWGTTTAPALWWLEEVEADGRTLVVRVATSGCRKFDHMTWEPAAETVLLKAWNEVWTPPQDGRAYGCPADLGTSPYRIALPEPLNGRQPAGQCVPGDSSPDERICDLLRRAADPAPSYPG